VTDGLHLDYTTPEAPYSGDELHWMHEHEVFPAPLPEPATVAHYGLPAGGVDGILTGSFNHHRLPMFELVEQTPLCPDRCELCNPDPNRPYRPHPLAAAMRWRPPTRRDGRRERDREIGAHP
jgi:hypothetical protein